MVVVTHVDIRTKKIFRTVGMSFFEILKQLHLLKNRKPHQISYKYAPFYSQSQDLIFLCFRYTWDAEQEDRQSRLLNILIKNFTDVSKRTVISLQYQNVPLNIQSLSGGELCSLPTIDYSNMDAPKNVFIVSEKGQKIEKFDFAESCFDLGNLCILKKTGTRCLARTKTHLICFDLKTLNLISSVKFSCQLKHLQLSGFSMSTRLGQKDYVC